MPAERRRVQDDVAAARSRAIASGSWPQAMAQSRKTPGEARSILRGPYTVPAPLLRTGRCGACGSVWCETASFASVACPFCGASR
jgi:hypothetical protein